MSRKIAAIILVFFAVTVAWFILGGTIAARTGNVDRELRGAVSSLWGEPQQQREPELNLISRIPEEVKTQIKDPATGEYRIETTEKWVEHTEPVDLDGSAINVDLALEHRKKGLLWYSTYAVEFAGDYFYLHEGDRKGVLEIVYRFPTAQASYDDFIFRVGGNTSESSPTIEHGVRVLRHKVPVTKGQKVEFDLGYSSKGITNWRYLFGDAVSRIRNFKMVMTTDFSEIDFPSGTLSPEVKQATDSGWLLAWNFSNLVSGYAIGMEMPAKMNPGPLAQQMSFFAPVCLGFFFVWIFLITLMKQIELHPMNYLFLAAAFFAFHLLFSYSVDHINLALAFALSSVVSVFLLVSYLRLVVGTRFAFVEAGVAQVIYLVLFSYAHFLEGVTGLIITIGSILTLFAAMQLTGRIRWKEVFEKPTSADEAAGSAMIGR